MHKYLMPDGPIFQFFSDLLDIILISILFVVFSLPIVSMGLTLTAGYDAISKGVKKKQGKAVILFFRSMKLNLKQGLLFGIIFALVLGMMAINFYVILRMDLGNLGYIFGIVFLVISLILFLFSSYVFPILSRFECSNTGLLQTALYLAVKNPGVSIQLLLIEFLLVIGSVLLGLFFPYGDLILPGLMLFAKSQALEPILEIYMNINEGEKNESETV